MQKIVSIKNKYNKDLSGIIEIPEVNVKEFIIISHCFTCCKSYKLYNNIAKFLVEKGYGIVRYDAMGLGNSEGNFGDTSFTTNVEDLITIHNYISSNYKEPAFLFGHSIGSLISIKAASILDSVKGVATVGSPSSFHNLERLFSNYEDELIENNNIVVNLAGRNINIGLEYLNDLRNESMDEITKTFKKPIIMFHSNSDRTVNYGDGLKLFNSIDSDKNFITLRDVDHLAGNKKDSIYIGEMLYAWLENF